MKAAVYTRYGPPDVVQITDVEKPVPKDHEVLVRVHATTVCPADWRLRKPDPFLVRLINGLWKPEKIHILGMEFAGTVESVGKAVIRFAAGDQVFGATRGTHAEYACVSEDSAVALKPVNMTLEEAAAVMFGGISALHFLREAKIRAAQKVLIYGASGSLGTFAVQLAKHFGAHVTGVSSTANLDLVKSLGADEVVDYTREDFSRAGRVYDIVFDTVGKSGFSRSMRSLKRGGVYARAAGAFWLLSSVLVGWWTSLTGTASHWRAGTSCPRGSVFSQGAHRGRKAKDGDRQTLFAGPDRRGSSVRGGRTQKGKCCRSRRIDEPVSWHQLSAGIFGKTTFLTVLSQTWSILSESRRSTGVHRLAPQRITRKTRKLPG